MNASNANCNGIVIKTELPDTVAAAALPPNKPTGNGSAVADGAVADAGADKKPAVCAKCSQAIRERFYMKVDDRYWHDQCLRCDHCDCQLGDAYNQTLFTRDNRLLCKTDYMR